MRIHRLLGLLVCVVVASAAAQEPPAAAQSTNARAGLTGFWALRFDSRNVPAAQLTQGVTAAQITAHRRADQHVIRWCQAVGMPLLMQSTAPLDIVQGTTQIAITSEMPSAARHIYLDRKSPPGADTLDPAANGFSIGHWDGQTLLVHTIGFSDVGYTSLPGGGFRTSSSELTERYQLVEHGRELEVTFTWTDPKVFQQPHTYAFRYYRVPRGFNAGESFCDSNDQERAAFLTRPPEPVQMPPP
jgi:hypothetical protein